MELLGVPEFHDFLDRMRRLNRVARMGCNDDQVLVVSGKIFLDYEAQGMLHLLVW